MAAKDLMAELVTVLESHGNDLSESEIKLISLVMAGFVYSPLVVRLAVAPKIRDVAEAALTIMRGQSDAAAKEGGGMN